MRLARSVTRPMIRYELLGPWLRAFVIRSRLVYSTLSMLAEAR